MEIWRLASCGHRLHHSTINDKPQQVLATCNWKDAGHFFSFCSGAEAQLISGPMPFSPMAGKTVFVNVLLISKKWITAMCGMGQTPFVLPIQQHQCVDIRTDTAMLKYVLKINCLQCFDADGWASGKSIRSVENWLTRYWCNYLSGARCKWSAYGPADATATPSSLASLKSRLV